MLHGKKVVFLKTISESSLANCILKLERVLKIQELLINQIENAKSQMPKTNFDELIRSSHTWEIKE